MDKKNNSDIIYHYCSADAFYNIISSRFLRFTDIRNFRDIKEREPILKAIDNSFLSDEGNLRTINVNTDQIKNVLYTDRIFVACFSKKDDDLNQWRAYGEDGAGFCVGFNLRYFNSFVSPLDIKKREKKCFFKSEIYYDERNHSKFALELRQLQQDGKEIDDYIRLYSIFNKYDDFREEEEVRLWINEGKIGSGLRVVDELRNIDGIDLRKGYWSLRGKINEHIEVKIDPKKIDPKKIRKKGNQEKLNRAIVDITLGPSCKSTEYDIYRFANSYGLVLNLMEIHRSNIPYL